MGLLAALNSSVSGLNVNQQQLNTLSQNIANANTPDYSAQVAHQQASFINGLPQGVTIASISRQVNAFLTAEVRNQTTANGTAATVKGYFDQVENLLGQPGGTNSIDQSVTTFFTALQDMANAPSVSAQTSVLNAAQTLSNQISALASKIQNMRLQADQDISTGVSAVNADLAKLQSLNTSIEHTAATGGNTSGLLDQRDSTLTDIAQYVDINPTFNADGEVTLNTTNGVSLLTLTGAAKMSYTGATSVLSFTKGLPLSALQVTTLDSNGNPAGNPQTLVSAGLSGSAITTSLVGGKIAGDVTARDTLLPNILNQLDTLAAGLRDNVNAVSNSGTPFPPPSSYTGARLVTGNQATQFSGSIRIAMLGTSGSPIASPYADEANGMQPLTLDLSKLDTGAGPGIVSVDGLVTAINQYYGPPQNKVEIGNLNNVQLGVVSSNIPDTGGTLSMDFNLNNTSGTSGLPFYVTGMTVLDSSGATVTTQAAGALNVPKVALSTYTATGTDTITIQTSGTNTLTNGEQIYLSTPTTPAPVGGISTSAFSGQYYTVQNVTGSTFTITVAGVATTAGTVSATGANALPPDATSSAGSTMRTGSNGVITADISGGNTTTPYYTVQADIATVDATGNVKTSTVTYRVVNNASNTKNDIIGASTATGNGVIVVPSTTAPIARATLVDANGNPLTASNGSYGSQQGYLKISTLSGSSTIAIDELDSKQLGLPSGSPPQPGTNQGFSQYFGLNNFFNVNQLTATGDTLAGSALNLSVASRIAANAALISSGKLAQNVSADGSPNYTYSLASGDNSVAQQLAGLATNSTSFAAAGGMPSSSTTFTQYAGQIIAVTSTNATTATNTANDSQTLLSGFTAQAQTVSGVNLDQQLANTVIYQNAYTASARIITVVSQMFTDLLSILQ